MQSGYIEDEMEFFTQNIQKMVQAELDRYYGSVQLISDYYNALDGKDLPDPQEKTFIELLPGPAEVIKTQIIMYGLYNRR